MDSIFGESTISMAFDNWQQGIPRTWQTGGHSSLYHRGVAIFMKRNKAILLPIGSLIMLPSGLEFRVTTVSYKDAWVTVIMGDLVTKIYPLPFIADGDINVISNKIAYVTSGLLLFPCIG
jgi:hypothetical protein